MKKILLLLLLLTTTSAVMAQDYTDDRPRRRGFGLYLGADRDTLQYVIASPFDNWYIEGGIGGQTFIGNEFEDTARWNTLDYNLFVEVGKWIIPDVAVALNLSHFGVHSQTRYGNNPWVDFSNTPTMSLDTPHPGTYYAYEPFYVQALSLTGLVYIEWTNLFNGYELGDTRKLHFMSPIGLGYTMLYGGQRNPRSFNMYPEGSFRRNFELHALAGFDMEYRVTKALTLHATAAVRVARGSVDTSPNVSLKTEQSGIFDIMPTLQVGARFNMLKRVTKVDPRTGRTYTAVVNHQFLPAHAERITYLENRIDTLMIQMSTIATSEDREVAANLAAVRELNHQLDSLKNLLDGDKPGNAAILDQIAAAQDEIDRIITIISEGRKPLDLSAAEELVDRQLSRQDSIDLLTGRLNRLQRDLDKGSGSPMKIKEEMGRVILMRDRLLDDADADNYEYGVEDEQGLYSPLDASQTAYRRVLYNDLLNRLYEQLAVLQQKLDSKEVDRDAVNSQVGAVRAEMARVEARLNNSGRALSEKDLRTLLVRQRQRRDSLANMADRMMALNIRIADSIGSTPQHLADLERLAKAYRDLLATAELDNRNNLIDNMDSLLNPYVAVQVASDQAAIRNGMNKVSKILNDVQSGVNSANADPAVVQAQIAAARRVIDSLDNSVSVGGENLTADEAASLLTRQQQRQNAVVALDRRLAEQEQQLKSGTGNPSRIRAEMKRLASQRQDLLDQAKADNDNYGVTNDHGTLDPFEAAEIAVLRKNYRELLKGVDHKMDELQHHIDRPESNKDEVRDQIYATKAEIDHIYQVLGQKVTPLTTDQLKDLVAEQSARQDTVVYLDRRISSLSKRLERGNGDPKQISAELSRLKAQRDALVSQSKKANADAKISNADNTMSPLVAAQNAYDQSNLTNRVGSINSMLDALLRGLSGTSGEQVVLNQIAVLQRQIDSAMVAGHLQGVDMSPDEADALVARQQARLDSINDIDRSLRELNRLLDKGQGDPEEIEQEIAKLTAQRGDLGTAALDDNRAHGIISPDLSPLAAAREAARQSRRFHDLEALTAQLDSLQSLLTTERFEADPMAQINEAISQLDLPMARVYYQLDKFDLDYNARKVLHDFALKLKKSGTDLKYYIIGAADAQTGSIPHNKWLSTNRCKAVYDVLVHSYGVPEEQLEMFPLGGITEFEQQENNRTAIIVLSNHEITKIIEKWHRINGDVVGRK